MNIHTVMERDIIIIDLEREIKRPRLNEEEEKPESLVSENGLHVNMTLKPAKGEEEPSEETSTETEAPEKTTEEASDAPQQTTEGASEATQQTSEEAPEVPNDKAHYLQFNSGVKIQIMKDAEVDPQSTNRPVEPIGGLCNINKAGKLIIMSGETIHYLQFNSGAKIQIMRDADVDPQSLNRPVETIRCVDNINKAEKLIKDVIDEVIPQQLPEGVQSKERTVQVSGDKKRIERGREKMKEVMNQPPTQASSGGYNQQQSLRLRGPSSSQQQWGPNASQPTGYNEYQQRGYPSSSRGNFISGCERPPSMQGPPHQGGGDCYGYGPYHSNSHPSHGLGLNHSNMGPPSQGNYNYGQPHGQPAYSSQDYGQGYREKLGPGLQQPYCSPQPWYGWTSHSYRLPPLPALPTQQGRIPYQGGPAPAGQQAQVASYGSNPAQQGYGDPIGKFRWFPGPVKFSLFPRF